MVSKRGTVKWFDDQKGYGFLVAEDCSQGEGGDVFVHMTAVVKAGLSTLKEGDVISYDFVRNEQTGRFSAENIKMEKEKSS
nr:cold shock domain-containing protein [Candidatus Liberibacter sp.]